MFYLIRFVTLVKWERVGRTTVVQVNLFGVVFSSRFTSSVVHGIALIFHYWTDHEAFCEIDLLKRNETCRVQQGLWEYYEKYKKLEIELCSYGMLIYLILII